MCNPSVTTKAHVDVLGLCLKPRRCPRAMLPPGATWIEWSVLSPGAMLIPMGWTAPGNHTGAVAHAPEATPMSSVCAATQGHDSAQGTC